jgi:hypothetical protein
LVFSFFSYFFFPSSQGVKSGAEMVGSFFDILHEKFHVAASYSSAGSSVSNSPNGGGSNKEGLKRTRSSQASKSRSSNESSSSSTPNSSDDGEVEGGKKRRMHHRSRAPKHFWTTEDDKTLENALKNWLLFPNNSESRKNWKEISVNVPERSAEQCKYRWGKLWGKTEVEIESGKSNNKVCNTI